MMDPFELSDVLDSMVVLVDSREQPTAQAKRRYAAFGVPYETRKLNFGDYSVKFTLPDENMISLENDVIIERKYDLAELCMCFCQQRGRFEREFERIKASGAKCYLLVENANWEKVYAGQYRTQMRSSALVASILAYTARYNCVPIFCKTETSGKMIHDILYREGKERLERILDTDD